MKLVVFGANGGIGRQVVEQALAAGHQVTAVVRRPETLTLKHACLTVVRGDALNQATIAPAVAGHDAVISALGIASDAPTTLYSDGVNNIMQAMKAAGVRRILCISASGLNPGPLWQRILAKPLLWYFFRHMYTDLVRMETAVKAEKLDWTIIRPPRLTDKPRTGQYQIRLNTQFKTGGITISRADVADYILNHLADALSFRGVVEVAY